MKLFGAILVVVALCGPVVPCAPPVEGLPPVVERAFSSLRLVVLPVSSLLGLVLVPVPWAPPAGDVVPSLVLLGVPPAGPVVVVDVPPLLASLPLPVGGRLVGRA